MSTHLWRESVVGAALLRAARSFRAMGATLSRPFRPVVRSMRAFDEAVDRARAAKHVDEAEREARVREVLAESRIVRFLDWLFALPAAAWPSSAVARRVMPVVHEFRTLERAEQIRLAGWMLAVGLIARIVSYFVMGGTAGWVTALVWLAVFGLAVVMMVWNRQIAAAWDERRARRRS